MSSTAEKKLADLRKKLSELQGGVGALEKSRDREQCRVLGERITQALLAVDGVDATKSAAAEAFRERDRKTAMAIAVLVTRRRAVVKELHALGDRVDRVALEIESSVSAAQGKSPSRDAPPSSRDDGGAAGKDSHNDQGNHGNHDDDDDDHDDDDPEDDDDDGDEGEPERQ